MAALGGLFVPRKRSISIGISIWHQRIAESGVSAAASQQRRRRRRGGGSKRQS